MAEATIAESVVRDINCQLLLVRSAKEVPKSKKSAESKKKINLPVTDCRDDPDYEKNVKAIYQIPKSYVRYVRKVGDETDMALDYCMDMKDKEWMLAHPVLSTDKECRKYLTPETFETIVNICEHHTAFSKEPIPEAHADKLVAEALGWTPPLCNRIVNIVYKYWLYKRNTLKKPLCRLYWPQTPAADQHPHLTFRPRAAEKYRLRRQYRKNDLESFRKMKQLKVEFGRAHDLLCLCLEREGLREAELILQQEIFGQSVFDIDRTLGPEKDKKGVKTTERRRTEPVYAYKLTYEELLKEPDPPSAVMASMYGIKGHGVPGHVQQRHAAAEEQRRQQRKNRELQALQRKRRGEGSGVDVAGASGGAAGSAAAGAEAPPAPVLSAQDHQRALEESALQHVHANVPGPRVACRPTWPHFLSTSVIRQQMPAAISTSSYVEELREVESTAARSMETARRAAEQQEQEQGQEQGQEQEQEHRRGGVSAPSPVTLWGMYGPGSSFSRIGNNPEGVMARLRTGGDGAGSTEEKGTGVHEKATVKSSDEGGAGAGAGGATSKQWRADAMREMVVEEVRNGLGNRRLAGTRTRARVGRGGRLVLDRLPVYLPETPSVASEQGEVHDKADSPRTGDKHNPGVPTVNPRLYRHIYPTTLVPNTRPFAFKAAPKPGADGAPTSGTSEAGMGVMPSLPSAVPGVAAAPATAATTTATSAKQTQLKELYYLPPTHPAERGIASAQLGMREVDYYACSDSEGEEIFVPALHVIRKRKRLGSGSGHDDEDDVAAANDRSRRFYRQGIAGPNGGHDYGMRSMGALQTNGAGENSARDHWSAEIEASGSDSFKYYPMTPRPGGPGGASGDNSLLKMPSSVSGAARGMGLFTSIAAVTVPVPPADSSAGHGHGEDKFRLLV